jgi:hypothetical protein
MRLIDAAAMPSVEGARQTSLAGSIALLAVPAVLLVAGLSVVKARDQVPGLSGSFQATAGITWACGLASAAVAAVFGRSLWRLAPPWQLPHRQAIYMALGAWIGGFMFLAMGACGTVNRTIGRVSVVPTQVQAKFRTQGRGCHRVVEVVGATIESGTRLCVDEARWPVLQVGDSLAVVRVTSDLGEQVGLMPVGTEVRR